MPIFTRAIPAFCSPAAFDYYGVIYHNILNGLTVNVVRQNEPLNVSNAKATRNGLYALFGGKYTLISSDSIMTFSYKIAQNADI